MTQGDKAKQEKLSKLNICACGKLDPKYKGYCLDCLKQLKETFDKYIEKFKVLSEEYDNYTGKDQTKADEKLRLMKNKIEQYEIKLSDGEMLNVLDKYE